MLCPVDSSPLDLTVAGNFADDALNWKWPAYFVGRNLPQGRLRRQQMQDELGPYGLAMVPRAGRLRIQAGRQGDRRNAGLVAVGGGTSET